MKVFISHDHEDAKACAPLLRTLDAWGVNYYFDYAEDVFGQQLSNRVQAELTQSQVLLRVCTRATPRSYWMSIESGAFMGLIADEQRAGRSGRRIVSLILDPAYRREPFDVTTTVIDATDTAHPQWVNTLRGVLGLPPLHDLAEVARAIYSPPAPKMSRRAAIGLGTAGIVALAVIGAGGLVLLQRGKSPQTTVGSATPVPPSNDPAIKWAYFAGDPKNLNGTTISASPVLDNGVLYFGTQEGRLYALRAEDRTLLWQYPQPPAPSLAAIWQTAAVANGVAYFCAHDSALYAVSTSNGAKLWERDGSAVSVSSRPVLANGLIYINDIGSVFPPPDFVAVVDPQGDVRAALNPTEADIFGVSAPLVADGRVYVGGNDGYVYALNATTPGPELWRAETGAAKDQQLKQPNTFYVTAAPTIADGIVYVGSLDNSVYALDARSGAKLWSFPTNGQIIASSPTPVNGVVYVGSNDNTLYALDAHSGKLIWRYTTGDKIDGTPTIVDGVVYVGAYDKYVHAVDSTSGELIRKYHVGGNVFARVIVADGVLYALTTKGWMLAFRLS